MSLLNQVTEDTIAIIWHITEDNVFFSENFDDLNYLFDNGLAHIFKEEVKTDSPYFFQTKQYDQDLYLMAFKNLNKKISEVLENFNNLNFKNTEGQNILVVDKKKMLNKELINKSVKNLNISGFNFIS